MLRPATLCLAAALVSPAAALAAEPIVGTWRLANGETVTYAPCGDGFCSVVDSGRYKGKSVGRLTGSNGQYVGTVIDPSSDKSYEGRAEATKTKLDLTGCVAKVFCRTQTWTR
ncbi:DUF2147 domain-containing protein [Aureimonas sp. AU12]|uniref:DUF2147 domain-containing protein n=1 Tax=Aureimonas sp. AU12 TaxID=1638161 RepID=UPI000780E8C6|nr:DUF2147 domain-containing protein [Aureimonas sp. AU12]